MIVGYTKRALRVASVIQKNVDRVGLGSSAPAGNALYDRLVTEPELRRGTRRLFLDGHYAQAVEEACKCLNDAVRRRTGMSPDGASLMQAAFGPRDPMLRINPLETPSDQDQQRGYMDILAGYITGIRNPRAHQYAFTDEADIALEMLTWANHLMRIIRTAKRTRKASRKAGNP